MEPISILLNQLRDIARDALALMPQLVGALLVLVLTYFVALGLRALVQRGLARTGVRASLKSLCVLLAGIITWLAGIVVAAVIIFPNLTPASVVAGLGLGSVAIGFAFKDVFENFFAGFMILFRQAMRIGDFIECEDYVGKVERITVRETYVRQTDGQLVILPNATLFKNPLTVITDQDQRRTTIIAGVAYGENVDEARGVIEKAVRGCESVVQEGRPVEIFAQGFGSSSIDFEVTWWTGSRPVDVRASRDEVVAAVKRGLDEAGIEIPFPYRTLTFKEPLPITRETSDTGESS